MKNIIPFSPARNRSFKKRYHRRKTSLNSFWRYDSEEIKREFDSQKVDEVCRKYPWSLESIEEKYLRSKPLVLGLEKRVVVTPEYIIYDLFKGDDLNSFLIRNSFRVKENIKLGEELNDASLIIPNPNRVREGRTKDGRVSSCCRDAIGKRRYLVVETSYSALDESMQASIINYLRITFKHQLKMVVETPKASLQAWFFADCSEYENWKFMNEAVSLGANKLFWRPEAAVRMPNGYCRETGQLQSCVYYDTTISNIEEVV